MTSRRGALLGLALAAALAVFGGCRDSRAESGLAASGRLSLEGAFQQGGLVIAHALPGTKVTLDGRPVLVAEDGTFVFGFDRDQGPEVQLALTYPDGVTESRTLTVAARSYDIQRIDGLPPSKVTPRTPEQIAHIKRDQEMKRAARAHPAQAVWFTEGFVWPAQGPITGVFGSQRILNGQPRRPHYGLDIAAPRGSDVVAPAGGVVTLAASDMYFEGGLVFIDHGLGLTSAFLHMDSVEVSPGDQVQQGQVIGTVGAAGRATGPHLDWRLSWFGRQLDPGLLVGAVADGTAAVSDTPSAPP